VAEAETPHAEKSGGKKHRTRKWKEKKSVTKGGLYPAPERKIAQKTSTRVGKGCKEGIQNQLE